MSRTVHLEHRRSLRCWSLLVSSLLLGGIVVYLELSGIWTVDYPTDFRDKCFIAVRHIKRNRPRVSHKLMEQLIHRDFEVVGAATTLRVIIYHRGRVAGGCCEGQPYRTPRRDDHHLDTVTWLG